MNHTQGPSRPSEAFAEGARVRSTNAVYRPYGVGRVVKVRDDLTKVEFNPSVFMAPPYRSENKILSFSEMERVETPLERAARGEWEEPWRFELKMQAARFLTGNKGGQLGNARTEILPHQIFTAHRVVSSPRRRFLLADEVGLGKTIEAGTVWQTQKEIAEAVERAKRAYEIATRSLFRDVSSYSFDSYRRELASDLTLDDLRAFTERFLTRHRRQVQRKESFLKFLTPDVLRTSELPERVRNATFDRELAIHRPDAEFLALGHSFVDAMLQYAGSYDFGGLTAVRHVAAPKLAGRSGFLFVFVVRQRITREDSDECLFRFEPVFVSADGRIDEEAVWPAVAGAADAAAPSAEPVPDSHHPFDAARRHLEEAGGVWDWADDVEFLGLSWVVFR